jgi:hypothetical protein
MGWFGEVVMVRRSKRFTMCCWIGMCLAASTCIHDAAIAAQLGAEPDTADVLVLDPQIESDVESSYDDPVKGMVEDGVAEGPVYREWWFWAIGVGLLVAVALAAGSGGEDTEPSTELPDFPDPPDR